MNIPRPPEFWAVLLAFCSAYAGSARLLLPVSKPLSAWSSWTEPAFIAIAAVLGWFAAYLVKRVCYPDTP